MSEPDCQLSSTSAPDAESVISVSDDGEEEFYSVDYILGKKVRKGVVFYLIKWEGYDESESTWEPMENCEFAMSAILEFEEEMSVKTCSENDIVIVGVEPSNERGGRGITVLVKTVADADRVFKFDSKEVAERWPIAYVDFLQQHIKFWKRKTG